ncbi:MAG: sigma 54-interacting transcriptional regulator [Deltaproteobacteria bacterium]|nr:sigma 54-interacting transcriptional regulator [Deltaproteobacteria bacterium]
MRPVETFRREIKKLPPTEVDAMLDLLLDGIAAIVPPGWAIAIDIEDALTNSLVRRRILGSPWGGGRPRRRPLVKDWGILDRAFFSGEIVTSANLPAEGPYVKWLAERTGVRVIAVVPLKGEKAFGIVVLSSTEHMFPPGDECLRALNDFLAAVALPVRKAILSEERKKLSQRLENLYLYETSQVLADYLVTMRDDIALALLAVHDRERDVLRVLSASARRGDERAERFVNYERTTSEWLSARALAGRLPVWIDDLSSATSVETTKFRPFIDEDHTVLVLSAPLILPEAPLFAEAILPTTLAIAFLTNRNLTPLDRAVLSDFPRAFSRALVGGEGRLAQPSGILYLNELIASRDTDLEQVLEEITRELVLTMHADAGFVLLVDARTGSLLSKCAVGVPEDVIPKKIPLYPEESEHESLAAFVARSGKPYVAEDTQQSSHYLDLGKGIASEIGAPLKVGGQTIGVVVASSRTPGFFRAKDLERLEFFANNVAWSIDNARLIDKARADEEKFVKREQEIRFGFDQAVQSEKVTYHFGNLVGDPRGPMGRVFERIDRISKVADDHETVLITGETGCGKEMVAFAVHNLSRRREKALVVSNFASFGGDPNLIQSELFGHEKGAFTGATGRRVGCFERANGTTLFIDEVGDIVPSVQVKLLRVLQSGRIKEFQRLGGEETQKSDVRVLAATNADMRSLIADGRFREDLFYRLNLLTIQIPPLRDRRTDIPLLANHLLAKHARAYSKPVASIRLSEAALRALMDYHWPGNVRQLEAILLRALILYGDPTIVAREDVDAAIQEDEGRAPDSAQDEAPRGNGTSAALFGQIQSGDGSFWEIVYKPFHDHALSRSVVRGVIETALAEAGGYYKRAARLLAVEESDYMRFMDFLKNSGCKVDFRKFRKVG